MAYEGPQPLKLPGLTAAADLSAKQYFLVKLASASTVNVCSAATDIPIGVLQNKPTSGQACEIVCIGQTKIVCSADLAAGDTIGTDNAGKAATYAAGTDTTKYNIGRVILDNSAANGLATAVVNCANPARFA